MFRTFRLRLLFWFLVFIGSSFIIIVLSMAYLRKREEIFAKSEDIDQAYLTLLKSVEAQQDFFSYETKNGRYFLTGKSEYLDRYGYWMDSTLNTLTTIDPFEDRAIYEAVQTQVSTIQEIDSLFLHLTGRIKVRGFKDFSLEGDMRKEAHWLEQISEIPVESILSLRRHEKDYIIRHEPQYVDKFAATVTAIAQGLEESRQLSPVRKDTILHRLTGYKNKFLQLVALDREIGIKDNTGLKVHLDQKIKGLEKGFSDLVTKTRKWARDEFDKLTLYFGLTVLLLILISIIISAFIAHRITRPLTELTQHITRFVDSNFTLEKEHPMVRSQDEIGSLTKNFSILKNEVISQMKFFKQRVEERTEELATANSKLARLIEANSRFVPREFLNNLGKSSIEEVALGDQVAREMTVVFSDIRNFTRISEELDPQENFDFLNRYLGGIVPIIQQHGGFIDKFIGDSVMALFPGAPDRAIRALLAFEDFLETFNRSVSGKKGMPTIEVGSGVHTGLLILGTIGHDKRLETTVISDAVNTAARVEGLTKHYQARVIVTEDTLTKIEHPENFHYRFLDKVKVKGKSQSLSVYEFLSRRQTQKIGYNDRYNEAIRLVQERKITESAEIWKALYALNPDDRAVKRFLDKCNDYREGKSHDWEEVTKMITK